MMGATPNGLKPKSHIDRMGFIDHQAKKLIFTVAQFKLNSPHGCI